MLRKALADDKIPICAQETIDSPPCEGTPLLQSPSGSKDNVYFSTEKSEKSSSGEVSYESEEEKSTLEEESDSEKMISDGPNLGSLSLRESAPMPDTITDAMLCYAFIQELE